MEKFRAIAGSALFLVLAPGIVAGLVPWWISGWDLHPGFFGLELLRVLGALLVLAGLPVLLESFARFALEGLGTPAPVLPTRHLVVGGCYRFVRNPMYAAVVSSILGQGLIFGNAWVLLYGALAWLTMHVFVVTYEEPTLRKTFGAKYETFHAHVPRWIPRLRPWREAA